MTLGGPGNAAERRAVEEFLHRFGTSPSGLIISGQSGIGKTTLWSHAVDSAGRGGVEVLSASPRSTETNLAYSGLSDLLGGLPGELLTQLPPIQRVALDRVLLRGEDGPPTDERAAAAAFLSVLGRLTERSPVLVAIDNVQWLDAASRMVVAYAAHRFRGPVGIVVTSPSTHSHDAAWLPWLQLPPGRTLKRLVMAPSSLVKLHRIVADRLGRSLPRPLIARIHRISGGNPFFALELARTLVDGDDSLPGLPVAVEDVVGRRLATDDPRVSRVLLALACGAEVTVTQLASVAQLPIEELTGVLDQAETQGTVTVTGNRVGFSHPLFAYAVESNAKPPQRRAMHRRLAEIADHPELRARHLALGTTCADAETLRALDTAADQAARRGSPGVAAELLDMGIELGDDDPLRLLRSAEQHFRSGSFEQAEKYLARLTGELPSGPLRATALMLRGAVHGYRDGALALTSLSVAVTESGDNAFLRVQGMMLLALAHGMAGDLAQSVECARRAVSDANLTGIPAVRSQALALSVMTTFLHGEGLDSDALGLALELEDPAAAAPATLVARNVAAVTRGWTGDLVRARAEIDDVVRRCREAGNEVDVVWAAQFSTMIHLWLGETPAAVRISTEAAENAELIGGQLTRITAMTCAAAVAAFRGQDAEATQSARSAVAAAQDSGLLFMTTAPLASLAFLQTSRRQYPEALRTLDPLLTSFDAEHGTEIAVGGYLPDAIEALIGVGRFDAAEPLIGALEANGARCDRAWMRAVGERGRAMLLAARGDLVAAEAAAERAMRVHEQLPMPFERARTQLVLGQLQKRRRRRQSAEENLAAARATFLALDSPVWARRAGDDLSTSTGPASESPATALLTSSESRIAHLAAAGLSNREIAAQLFVSAKTVEMHLSRVYRKLGIRSRAQLYPALHSA